MIRRIANIAGLLCLSVSTSSVGFELLTHQRLSSAAVTASVVTKVPEVLSDLGLKGIAERQLSFEGQLQTITDIIALGAKAEDGGVRPINHFFDPTRVSPTGQGGLRVGFLEIAPASPNWALEDLGQIDGQSNSFRDTRSYLLQALTQGAKTDREATFALVFKSLGMVIHHLQDMTQPQHVRNDLHCLLDLCKPVFIHNPSAFEKYTEEKFESPIPVAGLGDYPSVYSGSNVSTFSSARSLWFTGSGKGIAEFTNRNFVSAGTNFRYQNGVVLPDARYGFPLALAGDSPVRIQDAYQAAGKAVPAQIQQFCGDNCWIDFVGTSGIDQLTNDPITNPRASSLSIFDQDLQLRPIQVPSTNGEGSWTTERIFALNSLNFEAAHQILLKRAVGYSAGLIDYFFRGKLDFVPDPAQQGHYLIRNLGPDPMKGQFTLYYDDPFDNRVQVRDVVGQPLVWNTLDLIPDTGVLAAGASLSVPGFIPPFKPPAKVPGEYMLVFTGDMGDEQADTPNGVVGAVVAKKIRNEYNGALYILGLDANGVITSLRADKDGTKVIGGWDISKRDATNPNGVFVPPTNNVFDPLGAVYGASVTKPVLDKLPVYKQAQFGPGPVEYRVSSVTFRQVNNANGTISFFSDSLTQSTVNRIAWVARSPNEQIGTFEFQLVNISVDGRNAQVNYTRRFKDASGADKFEQSGVNLPTLTAPFSYQQFFGIRPPGNSSFPLVISDDGLTIRGFATTTSPGRTHTQIVATLGTPPQFRLEQTSISPTVSGVDLFTVPPYVPTGGTCSMTVRTQPDGAEVTSTNLVQNRSKAQDFESSLKEPVPIGNRGGAIVTYIREGLVKRHWDFNETICKAGGLDFDPATGQFLEKFTVINTGNDSLINSGGTFQRFTGGDYVISDLNVPIVTVTSTILDTGTTSGIPCGILGCTNTRWSEIFSGFGPAPRTDIINTTFIRGPGSEVIRALTDRFADVIVGESATSGAPVFPKFRGIDLSGRDFVADSSPLGEVFFALSDKSTVIHEPLPGTMPPVQIPENVIKLLAVVWL